MVLRYFPKSIKDFIKSYAWYKKIGFEKLFWIIKNRYINKYYAELAFQVEWAKTFKRNKDKVLACWKEYRSLDDILKICKFTEKTRILDVGCGISTVLHYILGERYGIDPLADYYHKIYKYPEGITVMKGFGENIPFPDNFFDVVFCSNALDHVSNPVKTVSEIHRVLKNSGLFVLIVETFDRLISRDLAHPHNFSKRDVLKMVKAFEIVFMKEGLWIDFGDYIEGKRLENAGSQLIMVLMKTVRE
ncbi:MAG: class I SAM-dependent methyltransferase [Candidatus Freyarchaeota archaeon]|nr:class I SAM-dependent methyltransferase [Candidatus Jordarchaeia archaeon]MBS7278343.1 class I SAM-dependent methyltransferase [Candidatus Jordarchaeia archaeon]